MLAWQAGRVEHVGLVTSSTTSAVVRRSSVTGAGAGIAGATFGFADGDDEAVAATVAAGVVGVAAVVVGDGAAAGVVQPAARTIAATAGRTRRIRHSMSRSPYLKRLSSRFRTIVSSNAGQIGESSQCSRLPAWTSDRKS